MKVNEKAYKALSVLLYHHTHSGEDRFCVAAIQAVSSLIPDGLPDYGIVPVAQILISAMNDTKNPNHYWLRALFLTQDDWCKPDVPVYLARYQLPMSTQVVPIITAGLLAPTTYGMQQAKDVLNAKYGSMEAARKALIKDDKETVRIATSLPSTLRKKYNFKDMTPAVVAWKHYEVMQEHKVPCKLPYRWSTLLRETASVYSTEACLGRMFGRLISDADTDYSQEANNLVAIVDERLPKSPAIIPQLWITIKDMLQGHQTGLDPIPELGLNIVVKSLDSYLPSGEKTESEQPTYISTADTYTAAFADWIMKRYVAVHTANKEMMLNLCKNVSTNDIEHKLASGIVTNELESFSLAAMLCPETVKMQILSAILFVRNPSDLSLTNYLGYLRASIQSYENGQVTLLKVPKTVKYVHEVLSLPSADINRDDVDVLPWFREAMPDIPTYKDYMLGKYFIHLNCLLMFSTALPVDVDGIPVWIPRNSSRVTSEVDLVHRLSML